MAEQGVLFKQRKFLLDANILIEAHKRYYGFDLCPGFWSAMIRHNKMNHVFSIDHVKNEIIRNKDKLHRWTTEKAPK